MQKFKRAMAITLAATMVIGSSVTAFAADDGHSSTGTGSNEGHVDKHVISVTLPTVPANSTPFNYTVDPERLVPETDGARYGSTTFTDNAKRDGVYFLNTTAAVAPSYQEVASDATFDSNTTYYTKSGDDYTEATGLTEFASGTTYYTQTSAGSEASSSYDNKSGALTATSQSSADVELTVEVAVGSNGSIDLVNAAPSTDGYTTATVADAAAFAEGTYYTKSDSTYTKATEYAAATDYYEVSDPELYLALVVGSDTTVLEAGKTASKKVTIEGIDSNFNTTYNSTSEEYEYTVKSTGLTDWNSSAFYLTGVASKASAENVTVPTLTVTWSYADPAGTTANTTEAYMTFTQAASGTYYIVIEKEEDTGFGDEFVIGDIDSLKINGVDVLSNAIVSQDKYISIKWSDVRTALDISTLTDVESLVATFSIDGTNYTATYITE